MAFLHLALQFAEELPPIVKEELEQLIASLQASGVKVIGTENGGLGLDASGVLDGEVPIGSEALKRFVLNRLTAGPGIQITNGPGTITISSSGAASVGMLMRSRSDSGRETRRMGQNTQPNTSTIVAYAPVTDGDEPPILISNGAGEIVMAPYTP